MGSIFPQITDQVNFCHKISVPLTCILNVLIIYFVISPPVHSLDITLDCITDRIITSPNYPSLYPNDAYEEWYITASSQRRILVTFNGFSLEEPFDSLYVIDMVNSDNVRDYTGENVIFPPFLSQGYDLIIEFTSSRRGRRQGFNISVSCYEASGAFSGRLVDGTSLEEGFLELSSESGEWNRVCEENLSTTVAKIICTELGYPGFNEISYFDDTCLVEEKCTRAPRCQDNTYRLVDCTREDSGCTSNTSVRVKCTEVGYKGCYDLGSQQLKNGSSFKSKEHCISSCRKDNIGAIAIMNPSECFCSTADNITLEDLSKISDNECASISTSSSKMKVYSAYVGFCEELSDTAGGSWDSNITWFGSIVHLTCMDGYSLNGSGTLQCVPESSPLHPTWNDSIPCCIMEGSGTTTSTADKIKVIIPVIVAVILIFFIVAIASWKWREKCYCGKGGFRQSQGQTGEESRSIDPRNSQGRAVITDSRTPDGPSRGITARHSNGPSRPSTSNSITPISLISSAIPGNLSRHSRQTQALPAPPVPFSHHPNASDRPFRLLHHINPKRQNHYISSNNEPNPYYYASSSDNQRAGSSRLEESYQEPSTVNIMNHAYEGTADQAHSLGNLDNTDAYYYASSSVTPRVATTSTTSPEETYQEPSTVNKSNVAYGGVDDQGQSSENLGNTNAHYYACSSVTASAAINSVTNLEETYQKPSTMKMADNAYGGRPTTVDQMHSNTSLENMLRFGHSIKSRPLPHRPSSSNSNNGPSLPPRKSSRGSKHEPSASASLRQRKPMVNENNNILGACSTECNVRQNVPKNHTFSHKRMGQAKTPLYYTLEKDEQQNRGQLDELDTPTAIRHKGDIQDPLYYCLENNNDSYSDSGIIQFLHEPVSTNTQDSTDVTDSSEMIDNILYTPMPSKLRKTKLSN